MSGSARSLLSLPRPIEDALRFMAPHQPEQALRYTELVALVERFLLQRTGSRSWAGLDVIAFVDAHARTRRHRIEVCCNLAAMLACVAGSDDLSWPAAHRLWKALAQACPDDPAAQNYLALGLAEFSSPEGAGVLDAMDDPLPPRG